MDHHVLFLVSVSQLVLLVLLFAHKGPSRNRFGLRTSGSLDGGAHLRLFTRSRASPAAHAHARIAGGACTRAHRRRFMLTRELRITSGASACAHRRRRTRTLIACGSCAHVRRPSPAAHAHASIHVGGRGRSHIPSQACQPFGAAELQCLKYRAKWQHIATILSFLFLESCPWFRWATRVQVRLQCAIIQRTLSARHMTHKRDRETAADGGTSIREPCAGLANASRFESRSKEGNCFESLLYFQNTIVSSDDLNT